VGRHQRLILLNDSLDEGKAVVLSEHLEEVLNILLLGGTGGLQDLGDDEFLVLSLKGRGGQDLRQLRVLLECSLKVLQSLIGGIKSAGLRRCGVLHSLVVVVVGVVVGGRGYQRGGVRAVNAEQRHRRLDRLRGGGGGVVADAGAGDQGKGAGGEHCAWRRGWWRCVRLAEGDDVEEKRALEGGSKLG
jgi:hypothetical protein